MQQQRVKFDGDIGIMRFEGDAKDGVVVPDDLLSTPNAALRLINGVVTDIRNTTVFYIDENALKHATQVEKKWQRVECAWDAVLIRGQDGYWRKQTAADELVRYASKVRYRKEVSGLTFDGMKISTSQRGQTMVLGAALLAQKNPARVFQWKAFNGWFSLSAKQVADMADAVAAHVESCFSVEDDTVAKIENGQITSTTQVDQAFAAMV